MRMSGWSSDVCSSDLDVAAGDVAAGDVVVAGSGAGGEATGGGVAGGGVAGEAATGGGGSLYRAIRSTTTWLPERSVRRRWCQVRRSEARREVQACGSTCSYRW